MTGAPAVALDRTRTARLDQALADTRARTVLGLPGGEVHRLGPALLTSCRVALPPVNGVFLYDARTFHTVHDERRLDACLAVTSTFDVPWSFNVWQHLGGPVLVQQLSRRGLVVGGRATAMWLDLPRPSAPPDGPRSPLPGWTVEPVRTPASASDWARTVLEVFALPADLEGALAQFAAGPAGPALLGRLHGIPVAAAAVVDSADLVEVGLLGVRSPWRGRGLGTGMLRAAEAVAARAAASACVALVPEAGMPLFQLLGYVPVSTVTVMVPPAPPRAAA